MDFRELLLNIIDRCLDVRDLLATKLLLNFVQFLRLRIIGNLINCIGQPVFEHFNSLRQWYDACFYGLLNDRADSEVQG